MSPPSTISGRVGVGNTASQARIEGGGGGDKIRTCRVASVNSAYTCNFSVSTSKLTFSDFDLIIDSLRSSNRDVSRRNSKRLKPILNLTFYSLFLTILSACRRFPFLLSQQKKQLSLCGPFLEAEPPITRCFLFETSF